ncbi:1-deoxy-D-xylulose-5-phosphate reductoisomerase [Marinibactrum halimedae]|uniref:1-deoxy-D-xylulose 5-phosphate reductoisomerase n=1 Tax=Marinibactrum halimedae TaxID=1444977 RepID=A0AA37WR31_9GAMM|nr:1-deoxy-D-xylulose-5-phosphate reductoisomerase [Marinibactrum halimedae]MCD9457577.1 1-deoxy-D-xylulose-5-phosphate reductoisomerase [Marinibactrum halimedae]GLS27997.1 1-deoxy-D-xylulose 5-phosphate reductoisomerase [Marinibactrum halimedae]
MGKEGVKKQFVTVLGSTGSIGLSTLDVISRHPERFHVYALTANTKVEALARQCQQYHPTFAVVADEKSAVFLQQILAKADVNTEVLWGVQGLCQVATEDQVDTVMAAIVGAAGLEPTLAAVYSGKKVLLANKESLVMAGALFMEAVQDSGAVLLPIDSEHNAIFQCLPQNSYTESISASAKYTSNLRTQGIRKLLLTGSGGPFRQSSLEQLQSVTPEQACNHPNWSMGPKISVDSATMMNKGLEFIEACWMFSASPADIEVVVHPQSVIHSMVEYVDGSVLAQLGNPDMRTPIAHALSWPERVESGVSSLDIFQVAKLDFEAPDLDKFPCLRLAQECADRLPSAATVLNAANEVAVDAFLQNRLPFLSISSVIEHTLSKIEDVEPQSIDEVKDIDQRARHVAEVFLASQ